MRFPVSPGVIATPGLLFEQCHVELPDVKEQDELVLNPMFSRNNVNNNKLIFLFIIVILLSLLFF